MHNGRDVPYICVHQREFAYRKELNGFLLNMVCEINSKFNFDMHGLTLKEI
jgi:hypothetical protein